MSLILSELLHYSFSWRLEIVGNPGEAIPQYFRDTRICHRWHAQRDAGQCNGNRRDGTNCAKVRHEEPKYTAFYSSSLTPSWCFEIDIFDPVTNPLAPTLPPHQSLSEKATWQRFNHGEILKERGNSSKHQNSAEKIFHTSSLIEYYRQSVIIHINSTENIRSYTS